ncbi:MAG: beta-ketoacyl synthase N-terminal-like domain-containing protein [Phycisphaerae bacterium]
MTHYANDIVITGAGLVTSLGLDRETTWRAVLQGRCGVGPLTAVESRLDPDKGGGQVNDPNDTAAPSSDDPREVRLLRRALREALDHAGLGDARRRDPSRCAILLGTTLHGMRQGGAFLRSGDVESLRAFLAGSTLSAAIKDLVAADFTTTMCSACSSGLASVAMGRTLLRADEADVVIAGGYDPISEYAYAGFNSMRLVSPGDLRPFARSRDGMKVAEGYAVVVLERATDAAARGADPLARLAGHGESCDAYHLSKPHPEGAGAVAAMGKALRSAGLEPGDIDLLVAHATATPDNDASEHAALAQVFGDSLSTTPVVAFKSHLGHSLGAAGTVDLILAALAIRDGVIPPCPHTRPEEIEFVDLRISCGRAQRHTVHHVLTTSLGFGGANVCMIVAAPPRKSAEMIGARGHRAPATADSTSEANTEQEAVITGVGVVLPGAIGNDAFRALVGNDGTGNVEPAVGPIDPRQYEHLLRARRTRRMSEHVKLCLAATAEAYRDAGIDDAEAFGDACAAVVGTTHGAIGYCESYYRQLIDEGVGAANPTLFAEGVPNAASAHLSTSFSITGFGLTLIGTRTAGLEALRLAAARIRTGVWQRAVVSTTEESTPLVRSVYRQLLSTASAGSQRRGAAHRAACLAASGAVTLVLESRLSANRRSARVRGVVERIISASDAGASPRDRLSTAAGVVRRLGPVDLLVESGSATPAGRIERLAARLAARRGQAAAVGWFRGGVVPELFSTGPFASLAAVLLAGRLPQSDDVVASAAHTATIRPTGTAATEVQRVGVICANFDGGAGGAVVRLA